MRLTVVGADNIDWEEVAARLRGVQFAVCEGPFQLRTLQGNCDALAFLDPTRFEPDDLVQTLDSRIPALVIGDACLSSDRLEEWSAAARRAGVQLALVNPDRYLPSRQLIWQELRAGRFGEPGLVRIHRWQSAAEEDQGTEDAPLPEPLLRDIDLMLWFMRGTPQRVYAVGGRPDEPGRATGTYLQLHCGFANGGMALLDYTAGLPAGDPYQSLSLIGSRGAASADDHQNRQLVYRGDRPQAVLTDEGVQSLSSMLQVFADNIQSGGDLSPSLVDWRSVLAVAAAGRQSLQSGQVVSHGGPSP